MMNWLRKQKIENGEYMKNIIELFKTFSEKYLTHTLISTIVATLFLAKAPNLFGIKEKTSSALYWLFIFCVSFLVVKVIVFIYKAIISNKNNNLLKESHEIGNKKAIIENLEFLWNYVDGLSPQDKKYLWQFLKTNNQPIEVRGIVCGNTILTNKDIVVTTQKESTEKEIVTVESKGLTPEDLIIASGYTTITLYKLKDNFFYLLKYSYQNYNRISHFDSEE